ncbi:transcriptional regulator [Sphingomonas aliaeris]|uniref:Transcriptional regulator n=1 Tax=Sphingomonas aliaeris TaxID=2759526 RepID=A0A974NW47_9SPHN|nr:transcriptional regulator [Sphingomonas aliaeris]
MVFGTQQELADAVSIARPSLSAIEMGAAWPRPGTLDRLMEELDLTWDMIAVRGEAERRSRPVDAHPRADLRLALGGDLREGRKLEGLSLRDLSQRCGLSASQLSRIERGEAPRSRAFIDEPDDLNLDREFRRLRFRHPELHRLWLLV